MIFKKFKNQQNIRFHSQKKIQTIDPIHPHLTIAPKTTSIGNKCKKILQARIHEGLVSPLSVLNRN